MKRTHNACAIYSPSMFEWAMYGKLDQIKKINCTDDKITILYTPNTEKDALSISIFHQITL